MGVDEALLQACAAGEDGFPCVRFYAWEPPTLSLGVHQEAASATEPEALGAMGVDLVRRLTGGRAVLHDRELTYTVVGRSREGPLKGSVMTAYRAISEALVAGLARLGVAAELSAGDPPVGFGSSEPCFARISPCEIQASGSKLIGSVQLQRSGCLLQHGSIPVRVDPDRLARATRAPEPLALRGLEDILGRPIDAAELADALAKGFEERFTTILQPGSLTPQEETSAAHLAKTRYQDPLWNLHRPRRRPSLTTTPDA